MLMHAARLELLLMQGCVSFCLPEAEIDRRCARWPEAVAFLAGLASLDLPCWLSTLGVCFVDWLVMNRIEDEC